MDVIDIEKTKKAIEIFKNTCPELFELGKLNLFHYFYCPISVALMKVEEYVCEEYESLELLILKLYDSGLTTAESIQKVTGLDEKLIKKIIYIEKNIYKHIEDSQITETGRRSINEGVNHAIYEVKKEIQFEALTGTVLDSEIEQRKDRLLNIRNERFDIEFPQNILIVSDSVKKDINKRLEEYKKDEKTVIEKNYKAILEVETQKLSHIGSYVVSFDYLPDPFVILRGHNYNKFKKKYTQLWKPTAISENNACILERKNIDISTYNIRYNYYFDYLKQVMNGFSINAKENEIIRNLVEGNNMLNKDIDVNSLHSEDTDELRNMEIESMQEKVGADELEM